MAFNVTLSLVDDYGRTTSKRYSVTDALAADALTSVGALITDLLALSDIGTQKHEITLRTVAANSPQSGANKDVGMTLHCVLDNAKVYPLKVPCPKAAVINADGTIDIEDSKVTDFVDNFLTGGKFRISEGNYITEILYGELDG